MKKKIILFTFLIFSAAAGFAQRTEVSYDYPLKPGMEGWRNLSTQAEMISACQIPDDILNRLSTAALVETCLNYPLFAQVMAYNNIQEGFNRFASNFNGFQELLSREDASSALLVKYKKMDPSGYLQAWSSIRKGQFIYSYLFIELLLAQDQIIGKFNTNTKKELARETLKKFDSKVKEKELFGLVGLSNTSFVMSKSLNSEQNEAYRSLRDQNEK